MLLILNLLLVFSELLLEFLYGAVDAPPQVSGMLPADHFMEMLRRGDDFYRRQGWVFQVYSHIQGSEPAEIPLESRDLRLNFRLRGATKLTVPRGNIDLHSGLSFSQNL